MFKNLQLMRNLGIELFADGQKRQELEYTFYGKLDDFSILESDIVSGKEEQEQYHIPLDHDNIGMRLRRINITNYVMTVKAKREGVKGKEEVEQDISEDTYNLLRETATAGYRKTRYIIPVEGTDLKWEVDVFTDMVEQRHPWVKLDLEVSSPDEQLPDLPFPMSEKIVAQGDRKTEEEQAFLDGLWVKDWNILNETPQTTGVLPDDVKGLAPAETMEDTPPSEDDLTTDNTPEEEGKESLEEHSEEDEKPLDMDKVNEALFVLKNDKGDMKYRNDMLEIAKQVKKDGGAVDTIYAMYQNGPIDDGDVPSKSGRDLLLDLELASRVMVEGGESKNALTMKGDSIRRVLNVMNGREPDEAAGERKDAALADT